MDRRSLLLGWATGWGVRLLDRLIAERFEPDNAAGV
jgi:hypothetical protein